MERSLTILNERGDTTITWPPESDDEMEKLIERKIAAGVTFYTVPKRKTGKPKPETLKKLGLSRLSKDLWRK